MQRIMRISIEDAQMRHGRKSRSVRVDGYKRLCCPLPAVAHQGIRDCYTLER